MLRSSLELLWLKVPNLRTQTIFCIFRCWC